MRKGHKLNVQTTTNIFVTHHEKVKEAVKKANFFFIYNSGLGKDARNVCISFVFFFFTNRIATRRIYFIYIPNKRLEKAIHVKFDHLNKKKVHYVVDGSRLREKIGNCS